MAVWHLARQGTAAVCERCELPVREPRCDLRSEQGQPSYGWWRGAISDGDRAIRRTKKEGRNSYGVFFHSFYGKTSKPTGPRDGQAVLQLQLALDMLHHGCVREGVQMQEHGEAVHWVLLLGEMKE